MIVVFLINTPFIKQLDTDLFVNAVSKKYKVKKVSLERIYKREFKLADGVDYISVKSFQELVDLLNGIGERIILISDLILDNNKELLTVLKNKNIVSTIYVQKGDLIENILHQEPSILSKFKKYIKKSFVTTGYHYAFKAASTDISARAKENINIHSIKYDEYIYERESFPINKGRYAVFLDQFVPHHPDIIHYWKKESVEPVKYYKNLNDYFDLVEEKYNIKVIISAHPKADYDEKTFNGRHIIKYKTPNLIKFSEFVMLHSTTSIASVVLENKPSIFLYYQEMLDKGSRLWTIAAINLAKMLNAPLVDLDNTNAESVVLNYDQDAYENFKYKYLINKELESKSNEEIVLENLERIEEVHK